MRLQRPALEMMKGKGAAPGKYCHKLSHFVQLCQKMELSESMHIQSVLIVHDLGIEIKAKDLTWS